jgi:hypothetical protein
MSTMATWDQATIVLGVPQWKPPDKTQETLCTFAFPRTCEGAVDGLLEMWL